MANQEKQLWKRLGGKTVGRARLISIIQRHCALALLVLTLIYTSDTHADDSNSATQEINNLAHEFAECSAFFILVSEAPRIREESPDTSKTYKDQSTLMLIYSATLTSKDVAQARQELAIQTMTRMMERDWSKISIVMNEYLYPCKELAEDPTARVEHLLGEGRD